MKKKTFLQIFVITVLCVAIMFVCGIIAMVQNSKSIVRERLEEETKLACSLLRSTDDFNIFNQYYNNDAFRITVIDSEGNVLFESDTKATLENHIDREEIRNAINNSPKAVERYSETFGCEMTYYAMKTQLDDNTEIVLRMAVKSSQISDYLDVALPIFICVFIVALVCSLIFSELLSKKIAGKITEVSDSLKSLNEGNYIPIATNSKEPELYSVLNQINELNASTLHYIEQVNDEHKKLTSVLENISQGILAVDENKKVIFANHSLLKIFGYEENPLGKDFIYIIDDLPFCEKISEHLGENYSVECTYNNKELLLVIKKIDGISFSDGVRSIVILTDITQEKQMAKQKSDFFTNASHELKTPVAVMQGLSELLLEKDLDDSSKKQVERIHKESVRLASLISDMLKLSRLENGENADAVMTSVDLKEIANEVLNELSSKIAEKGISAGVSGNGVIVGDGKKIYELIENLCSNAISYNKENGEINISISDEGNTVRLKVADTGIGIEKENIPRLCERFYRVDKSRSKKTGGTGLGLAIVKHICALHHAELSIESDLGLGTTVTVVFKKEKI
ncbi:MAG: ATP-binding protein [Eubacteriales bacterium]|nr:ATP-binding protein [Eubacteriales bacterium]